MKDKILLLSAPLVKRIWGGSYFKDHLNVTQDTDIGEMWTVSGYKDNQSIILNGHYKGETLYSISLNHYELFNKDKPFEFPILIKLIDAKDDLSIQVHPDDTYAREVENEKGKTEGWLILKTKENNNIIVGSKAHSKEEIEEAIEKDKIEDILNYLPIKRGNFFKIPSGTIHAILKDTLLFEVQQSSNITYRFYDYHRKDKDGNERELHVKKALDVVSLEEYKTDNTNHFDKEESLLWDNDYFKVEYLSIKNKRIIDSSYLSSSYKIVSVIEGEVIVDNLYKVKEGYSFIILPTFDDTIIEGNGKIVVTISKE